MNIALLVIDVQKAFIEERKNEAIYLDTLSYINAASALFRVHQKPVFIIRDIEEGDDEFHQNVDELITDQNDIEILKTYSNSFWKTELDEKLKEKKIDFLVLCGNAAEYCVLATYSGALERGYQAVILQHGVFARYHEGLLDLYRNRPLISYTALKYLLEK